jgi:hypothetical protein
MEDETKTTKMELKYRSTNTTRKDILEIPKGLSEAVNRRRIDNTNKGTKRQPLGFCQLNRSVSEELASDSSRICDFEADNQICLPPSCGEDIDIIPVAPGSQSNSCLLQYINMLILLK